MDTAEKLAEVVELQVNSVYSADEYTDQKSIAINDLNVSTEAYATALRAETEAKSALAEAKCNKQKNFIEIGTIVISVIVGIGATAIGYKFEETGTQTSQTFKRGQDWLWKKLIR